MTNSAIVLANVAVWNADRAMATYRQSAYQKNETRLGEMTREYKHHIHNADRCMQAAFLLSRTREGKRG